MINKIDDRHEYFQMYKASCMKCKHLNQVELNCKAFKNGIPLEILSGKNLHKKPLPEQDNDIVFEEKNN